MYIATVIGNFILMLDAVMGKCGNKSNKLIVILVKSITTIVCKLYFLTYSLISCL